MVRSLRALQIESMLPFPLTILRVKLLLLCSKTHHVAIIVVILKVVDRILMGVMRGLQRKLCALKKVRVVAGRATCIILALECYRISRVTTEEVF